MDQDYTQWTSIPTFESVASVGEFSRAISPPKPDTPPTKDSNAWSLWGMSADPKWEFSIKMPHLPTPKLPGNASALISPTKSLLPAHNPLERLSPKMAPHPSELPMPDKLLGTGL